MPEGRCLVRFLVLLAEENHFDKWDNADDALRERVIGDYNAFGDAVRQRGTLVVGDALGRPETARSLRPGVEPIVTDGPFAETKEQIGGYFVVDAKDLDEAIEIAAKIPGAKFGSIEVRPIWEM
jgi:hypothetical protein